MTKDDLVTAVVKSCKGDDLSKRLVSDVIDATFESIGKSIKRKNVFLIQLLEHLQLETEKQGKGETHKQARKLKSRPAKQSDLSPHLL